MTFEEAKEYLEDTVKGDDLFSLGWYLSWEKGSSTATLDGEFDVKDLQAIACFMQHYEEENKDE